VFSVESSQEGEKIEKFDKSKQQEGGSQFRETVTKFTETKRVSEKEIPREWGEQREVSSVEGKRSVDLDKEREILNYETEKRKKDLMREELKWDKNMFDLKLADDFKNLQKSYSKPIVIDFYKRGNEDCRRLYPQLMDKFIASSEEWTLVGANLDKFKDLAKEFNIQDKPSIILIHKGQVIQSEAVDRHADIDKIINKAQELAKNE